MLYQINCYTNFHPQETTVFASRHGMFVSVFHCSSRYFVYRG